MAGRVARRARGATENKRHGGPAQGDGDQDRLEQWDGRTCQKISAADPTAKFWSQSDVPYTLMFYWSSLSPLPGGAQQGRAVAPSLPGVDVFINIDDPTIVDRNPDYNRTISVTPFSTEYNPRTVTLPYGGDLTVRFARRETTPRDAEVMVCATTRP